MCVCVDEHLQEEEKKKPISFDKIKQVNYDDDTDGTKTHYAETTLLFNELMASETTGFAQRATLKAHQPPRVRTFSSPTPRQRRD